MDDSIKKIDLRDAVVGALTAAVEAGTNLVVLVSDSTSTSKIGSFSTRHPERLVNVGIAEQNLVGISAGLSLQNIIPVTMNAACFLVARSNEQVKNDICYSNTNVKLIGLNAGVTYGPLASTHHAIDDLSIMKGFGNILIWAPSDAVEATQMIDAALKYVGPVYIRLDNAAFPVLHNNTYAFQSGEIDCLIPGREVVVFAIGSVVHEAYAAAQDLRSEGRDVAVINIPSLRPLNRPSVVAAARGAKRIITVEEHSTTGGLGGTISEILAEEGSSVPVTRLGIPEGKFSVSGPRDKIRAKYQIDKSGIMDVIRRG